MNYENHYNMLIERAQRRNWTKTTSGCYVELHHILPRCLGGIDDNENLVYLTAKEHYVAHLLLAKIHNSKELWFAVLCFKGNHNNITGSMYAEARERQSTYMSENNPNKNKPSWNKGIPFSEESKQKMSDSQLKSRKIKSTCPHCGKSVDRANYSKWHGDNCKMSPNYVKPKPSPRKKQVSWGPRNLKLVTCPHCGKQGKGGNMTRWHFDNCRTLS